MAVTDNRRVAALPVNIRNKPYGDRPPHDALLRAEVCGRCYGELAPGEEVWMRSWCHAWSEYLGGYDRRMVAATCFDCSGVKARGWRKVRDGLWRAGKLGREYWRGGECASCGRMVYKPSNRRHRRFFCGSRCADAYYSRRRRRPKEQKTCEVCGEAFTAKRSDAKTCSPACKQKAYRDRKKNPKLARRRSSA